jgi:hypothetical protein
MMSRQSHRVPLSGNSLFYGLLSMSLRNENYILFNDIL